MNAVFIGYAAALVCIVLPFIYAGTAPDWWKSRSGRALMMLMSSLGSMFLLLIFSRTLRKEFPVGWEVLQYIVYSYVLVASVRLAVLFFQLRIGAEWAKERGENETADHT